MPNLLEPVLFVHETSCTTEEIVAKLLGWMIGPSRRANTYVTETGISEDQLPFMHSFEETSLKHHLEELREAARQELGEACGAYYESNEASDGFALLEQTVKAKIDEVERIDNLFTKAGSYLLDIDEEIDKGESSALKVDKEATEKSGVIHIKLRSADQWTQREYGISIIGPSPSKPEAENSLEQSEPQSKHKNKEEADAKGRLSKTMANNLYTTLALFVEEFASSATAYRHEETGKPNVSNIAKYLHEVITEGTEGNTKETLEGQSRESIKSRIEAAMRIKSKL